MRRVLPFRWIPAATMWQEGAAVGAIAAAYKKAPSIMKRQIVRLAATYPTSFPSRQSQESLREQLDRILHERQKRPGKATSRPAALRRTA
jgi:hypothetical protein